MVSLEMCRVPLLTKPLADEYKPILQEIEKIMAEAGLDEEEIRKGAGGARVQESRNRR